MQSKKPAQKAEEKRFGYPTIEALLDNEDFDKLNASFNEGYTKLTSIIDNKSSPIKAQKDARLAMKAYELTTDLLKELLKLKYVIQEQSTKNQKK